MKLEKYLADYIEHEEEFRIGGINPEDMEEIIKQGLDAFESTENMKITIKSTIITIHCPNCDMRLQVAINETVYCPNCGKKVNDKGVAI